MDVINVVNKLIIKMIPCECESKCGILIPEFDSQGRKRRFVSGHNRRGKHLSDLHRQHLSESHIGKCSGEDHYLYGKTSSEETKQKQREVWIKRKQDPNYNPKMYGNRGEKHPLFGKHHSPETKQLMSKNRIGKYCGENSSHWRGGISKEPYCQEWDIWLKEEIKERDDYQCKNPNCLKTAKRLVCHHIDYDKKNCSCDNLITLCTSCNIRANSNREYWKEFYNNINGVHKWRRMAAVS